MIKKIVLTGGPCAGKTTVLSILEKELKEKGYKVFIVNESATELINGGITPHEDGLGMYNFQKLILAYQYQKEEIYNRAVLDTSEEDIIIIYDRGILDNRAYITDFEFSGILNELSNFIGRKIDEFDLLSRYDMIIHLETSAYSRGYSLENNKARYESLEEAILLDRRIVNSWSMHDNFHIVKSTDCFDEKIDVVKDLVYKCIGDNATYKRIRS